MSHPDPHPAAVGFGSNPSDPGSPSLPDTGDTGLPGAGTTLPGSALWQGPNQAVAWGTEAALATLVMLLLAAFGVVLGVLWQWVTPGAGVLMTGDGPIHANPTSERYFADDGWFALIGGVAGVVVALTCWSLVRRHRGPVVMVGMVAGCLLAAVVAWQVGRHIGLAAFGELLDHAPAGRVFRRPPRLAALGVLGVQGFTAAFTYTLLAGWSRYQTLCRPTAGGAGDLGRGGEVPEGHRLPGHQDWAAPQPGDPSGTSGFSGTRGPTG
ncbi:MAG TPA: DUF2567 domain-containing protein [Micromonosporaceae bacterium]